MSYLRLSSPVTLANYVVAFIVAANAALVAPTLSLHLSQTYGLAAFWIGVFFIGKAASSILTSHIIARWSDGIADRRPLIMGAMFCGGISCLLFAQAETFKTLLIVACTIFGLAYTSWTQLMAQVREFADEFLPAAQATLFNSITRAFMAFAWVAGPPLGFLLMARFGFKLQCQIVAASYFATGLAAYFVLPKVTPQPKINAATPQATAIKTPRDWTLWGSMAAFTLMFSTNASYLIALPLMLAEKMHAKPETAGFLMGTAALLEIPLMVTAGYLSSRLNLLTLIRIGAAASVLMYLGVWQATAVWQLFVLQILNAIFVGFMAGIGMTWFQNLLPGRTGVSSSYFANSNSLGEIIGYLTIALVAQQVGYSNMYGFNVATAIAALILLLLVGKKPQPNFAISK